MQLKRLIFLFSLVMFVVSTNPLFSQDNKEELEKQRQKLQKEINYTQNLISKTKSKKQSSLNSISLISNQIKRRQSLINNYSAQIKQLENQIINYKTEISILKSELVDLKKEYASLIEQSYKSRNKLDKWVFIISSDDFYQAYRRLKYLRNYNDYRRQRAELIEQKTEKLTELILSLEETRDEHLQAMILKENEAKKLKNDKQNKQQIASQLQKRESELRRELAAKRKRDKELQDKITALIEAETGSAGNRLELTPEELLISKDFTANKQKLPWPVERGEIVLGFGTTMHESLKIHVVNKGIDIQCEEGAIVRSIFNGEVRSIIQLPRGKAVMIRHGEFYSVYIHLKEVYVNEGDKINTKDKIGMVYTNPQNGESVMELQIWGKNKKVQDPENWIAK